MKPIKIGCDKVSQYTTFVPILLKIGRGQDIF